MRSSRPIAKDAYKFRHIKHGGPLIQILAEYLGGIPTVQMARRNGACRQPQRLTWAISPMTFWLYDGVSKCRRLIPRRRSAPAVTPLWTSEAYRPCARQRYHDAMRISAG
jgi:hypothetical protein